jgi:transposase
VFSRRRLDMALRRNPMQAVYQNTQILLLADCVEKDLQLRRTGLPIQSGLQPGLKIMIGHRHLEQAALSSTFSLDKHVPRGHLLRSIDRFVALGEVRQEQASFDSAVDRSSIDSELMIRMLIVGCCFGKPSGR